MAQNNKKFDVLSGAAADLDKIKQILETLNPLFAQLSGSAGNFAKSMSGVNANVPSSVGAVPGQASSAASSSALQSSDFLSPRGAAHHERDFNTYKQMIEARESGKKFTSLNDNYMVQTAHAMSGDTRAVSLPRGVFDDFERQSRENLAKFQASTSAVSPGISASSVPYGPPTYAQSTMEKLVSDPKSRMAGAGSNAADISKYITQSGSTDSVLKGLESAISKLADESKQSGNKNAEINKLLEFNLRDMASALKEASKEFKVASAEFTATRHLGANDPNRQRADAAFRNAAASLAQAQQQAGDASGGGGGRDGSGGSGGGAGMNKAARALGSLSAVASFGLAAASTYMQTEQTLTGAVFNKELEYTKASSEVAQIQFKRDYEAHDMSRPENIIKYAGNILMPNQKDLKFIGTSGTINASNTANAAQLQRVEMMERERDMGMLSGAGKAALGIAGITAGVLAAPFTGGMSLAAAGAGAYGLLSGAGQLAQTYLGSEYTAASGDLNKGITGWFGRMVHGDKHTEQADFAQKAAREKLRLQAESDIESLKDAETAKHRRTQMALSQTLSLDQVAETAASMVGADAYTPDAHMKYMASFYNKSGLATTEILKNRYMAGVGSTPISNTFAPIMGRVSPAMQTVLDEYSQSKKTLTANNLTNNVQSVTGIDNKTANLYDKLISKLDQKNNPAGYNTVLQGEGLFSPERSDSDSAGLMRYRMMDLPFRKSISKALGGDIKRIGDALTSGGSSSDLNLISKAIDSTPLMEPQPFDPFGINYTNKSIIANKVTAQQFVQDAATKLNSQETMFAKMGITPSEYAMYHAQAGSVSNTKKAAGIGEDLTGANFVAGRGIGVGEALSLARSGVGSYGQLMGNVSQISSVTGLRGGESFDKLKDVMTLAVAAGFNGSHMAQQFVQTTTRLADSMKVRDIKSVSEQLVAATAFMSRSGDASDPFAMNKAAQTMASFSEYTGQRGGRQGVFKTQGAIAGGTAMELVGAATSLNNEQMIKGIEELEGSGRKDLKDMSDDTVRSMVNAVKIRNPGMQEDEARKIVRKNLEGTLKGSGKQVRSQILLSGGQTAKNAYAELLKMKESGVYDKNKFAELFSAMEGLQNSALPKGAAALQWLEDASTMNFVPKIDMEKHRGKLKSAGGSSFLSGKKILQGFIDKSYGSMLGAGAIGAGAMKPGEELSANLTTDEITALKANPASYRAAVAAAGSETEISRLVATQAIGAAAAEKENAQKVFVMNFDEVTTAIALNSVVVKKSGKSFP